MDGQSPPNTNTARSRRDSSISLEDHTRGLHGYQQRPEGQHGPRRPTASLFIPLDIPKTSDWLQEEPNSVFESPTHPSNPTLQSPSPPMVLLERYLLEEHGHERIGLGLKSATLSKAAVRDCISRIKSNEGLNKSLETLRPNMSCKSRCLIDDDVLRELTSPPSSTAAGEPRTSPSMGGAHILSPSLSHAIPRSLVPNNAGATTLDAKSPSISSVLGSTDPEFVQEDADEDELQQEMLRGLRKVQQQKRGIDRDRRERETRVRKRKESRRNDEHV